MPGIPFRCITIQGLVLAAIVSIGCFASRVQGGEAEVTVEIDNLAIQILAPAGMSLADELSSTYAAMVRGLGVETRAVFWPDSLLADLRAGKPIDVDKVAAAVVGPFRGDLRKTPEQMRDIMAYQWGHREEILRSSSTDKATYERLQEVLRKTPIGSADVALPLESESRVGLTYDTMLDRAGIQLQAHSSVMQAATGPMSITTLRAVATVIVRDRVLFLFLTRSCVPTTGALADLDRDVQEWIEEILAANGEAIPVGLRRDRSADALGPYPKLGEWVFVEALPEVIRRVPPRYPDAARATNVSGTVMVQALVGPDGHVKDTRIDRSIPALDWYADVAVRQWEFKPARAHGKPIAVWVQMPIKFTLH
jgi:TonB family protein